MARLVNAEYNGNIVLEIRTVKADGSYTSKTYQSGDNGDVIKNLRYIERDEGNLVSGELKQVSGRLTDIMYRNKRVKRDMKKAENTACHFHEDVICMYIDVDCSAEYKSNLVLVESDSIVEDEGVLDVVRVDCLLHYHVNYKNSLTDGTSVDVNLHPGQYINKVVYKKFGMRKQSSGRLGAFVYADDLSPISMSVISNGTVDIVDFDSIINIELGSEPITDSADIISAVASSDKPVIVGPGRFTDPLTFGNKVTIMGANSGVGASKRFGSGIPETEFSGEITIPDNADVTLDGVTLFGMAKLKMNGGKLTLRNCIIHDLKGIGTNDFAILVPRSDEIITMDIQNCMFGDNVRDSLKNFFEITGKLGDGSTISNNVFCSNLARNNLICIYGAADDSKITIENNCFAKSANAVRVGVRGEPKNVTVDITKNTYYDTDADPQWAGLMIIQPYGKDTISMAGVTINLDDNVNKSDNDRLWYLYTNATDPEMVPAICPTVKVNGKQELPVV